MSLSLTTWPQLSHDLTQGSGEVQEVLIHLPAAPMEGELERSDEQHHQFAVGLKTSLREDHCKPFACIIHHNFVFLLQTSARAPLRQTTPSLESPIHLRKSVNAKRHRHSFPTLQVHSSNLGSARRPEYNTVLLLKDVYITCYFKS